MIGVVADDLTGAAELGAVGLRYGLRAEVVVEGPVNAETGVVCYDTDSRSCSPQEAAHRAATAASTLAAAGVDWLYKKVDSVLRGQVVAELEAVKERLRAARILLVPANPGLGRVIRHGRYFIQGKPIDETNFRYDPEFPRLTSSVRDLLGKSSLPIHVCAAQEPLRVDGLTIGEAQSASDLRTWSGRWGRSTLVAGGAEFFGALLEFAGHKASASSAELAACRANGKQLFVCGSVSDACESFVSASRREGVPVFCVPKQWKASPAARAGLMEQGKAALRSNARAVLTIGLPGEITHATAQRLMEELTLAAAGLIQQGAVQQVFAEGGATAASLVRGLGWKRLEVLR